MVTSTLLLLCSALSCRYFIAIGVRPLSLIPWWFFLLFLSSAWSESDKKEKNRDMNQLVDKYWLIVSRSITMVGLRWVGNFLGISPEVLLHGLWAANLLILMWSLIYRYKDGIVVFHVAYRIITLCIWWWIYRHFDIDTRRKIVRIHIAANAAIYAFIHFVGGLFTDIPRYFKEILGILVHTTIILLLLQTSTNTYHGLFIAQVYITIIYSFLYYIYQRPEHTKKLKWVSLQDILSGKRILGKRVETITTTSTPTWVTRAQEGISQTSEYTKASLSVLNIIVILAMMLWFFFNIQESANTWIWELLYWLSIILFVTNFILIKKIDFYYKIQRVFVFFIINFAIYLSLINISYLFNRETTTIALIASVWNIANSIAIFYSNDIFSSTSVKTTDYYYRIAANLLAMIINIVLIARLLEVPGELRFALMTIYIGVQSYLMYYNIQYIKNLHAQQGQQTELFDDFDFPDEDPV